MDSKHILYFGVSPRYLNFRFKFRTDSELWHIQNPKYIKNPFNIPCETHNKILDTCKTLVYWELGTYSEYRESLEYILHIIFCNSAI